MKLLGAGILVVLAVVEVSFAIKEVSNPDSGHGQIASMHGAKPFPVLDEPFILTTYHDIRPSFKTEKSQHTNSSPFVQEHHKRDPLSKRSSGASTTPSATQVVLDYYSNREKLQKDITKEGYQFGLREAKLKHGEQAFVKKLEAERKAANLPSLSRTAEQVTFPSDLVEMRQKLFGSPDSGGKRGKSPSSRGEVWEFQDKIIKEGKELFEAYKAKYLEALEVETPGARLDPRGHFSNSHASVDGLIIEGYLNEALEEGKKGFRA